MIWFIRGNVWGRHVLAFCSARACSLIVSWRDSHMYRTLGRNQNSSRTIAKDNYRHTWHSVTSPELELSLHTTTQRRWRNMFEADLQCQSQIYIQSCIRSTDAVIKVSNSSTWYGSFTRRATLGQTARQGLDIKTFTSPAQASMSANRVEVGAIWRDMNQCIILRTSPGE